MLGNRAVGSSVRIVPGPLSFPLFLFLTTVYTVVTAILGRIVQGNDRPRKVS